VDVRISKTLFPLDCRRFFIDSPLLQGRRQKFFQGGGRATEKRPKYTKKDRKIALLSLFQDGPMEKIQKKSKK